MITNFETHINGDVVKSIALGFAIEQKKPKNKYKLSGKVVKLTKKGIFISTYNSCYTAASKNNTKPSRIHKCCIGKKGSTVGNRWMFQEDYYAYRIKVSYSYVEKLKFN